MVTQRLTRGSRPGAVSASTLFAIALAIVAGLIFAYLAREILLNRPKSTTPPEETREITVAAVNVYPNMEVRANQIKRVRVSKAEFESKRKLKTSAMLYGNQPVGRVAMHMLKAEDPIFEEDLYELKYPPSVAELLKPGMRPAVVTVPAHEAMVQVNDYVDVFCTLSNDALGPGSTGTAQLAKAAKVVARFGTTRLGAQPPQGPDAPRTYTLEVTPYREALIELAKSYGGKISLTNVPAGSEGDRVIPPTGNDPSDPKEKRVGPLNGDDLAAVFGIKPELRGPGPWVVEKYDGIKPVGRTSYPNYIPPSRRGSAAESADNTGADNRGGSAEESAVPTSMASTDDQDTRPPRPNLGKFRAPKDYDAAGGCVNCGKK